MLDAFVKGVKIGFCQWRTALIAYAIQFLIALVLGLQVYQVLEASIGHSLEINKLLSGFDDTVITDLFNVHGASLSPLLGQLRYVILVYLFIGAFVNAGLIGAVVHEKSGWKIFWTTGANYFLSFFKLSFWFILLVLIWSSIIWIPFASFFQKSAEVFQSEKTLVFLLIFLLIIYFKGLLLLMIWSIISRFLIVKDGLGIWKAITAGFKQTLRKVFALTGLLFLFVSFQLMIFGVYLSVENKSGMITSFLIIVFFILQQLLVLFRWIIRIGIYGGIKELMFQNTNTE